MDSDTGKGQDPSANGGRNKDVERTNSIRDDSRYYSSGHGKPIDDSDKVECDMFRNAHFGGNRLYEEVWRPITPQN